MNQSVSQTHSWYILVDEWKLHIACSTMNLPSKEGNHMVFKSKILAK
jgi:hypothetical protein